MSLFYKLAYWAGIKPWERAAAQESARISTLFAREEAERRPPYGQALDLGCGTGMQSVELARRGWQVTGIEIEPKAIREARERARAAQIDVHFVRGDVTNLRAAGVHGPFEFVLDFGLFHGLSDGHRRAMGREVTAVASPDATMLLIAWAPGHRLLLPRGASRADIEAAFPGWHTISEDPIPTANLPKPMRNANPAFYRLRRT